MRFSWHTYWLQLLFAFVDLRWYKSLREHLHSIQQGHRRQQEGWSRGLCPGTLWIPPRFFKVDGGREREVPHGSSVDHESDMPIRNDAYRMLVLFDNVHVLLQWR